MKKIGVFGSTCQEDKIVLIKHLFDKLVELDCETYIDSDFFLFMKEKLQYNPKKNGLITGDIFTIDLALSIGGDGTFLRTAARVNKQNIPILGINTGRLGFLADVKETEVEDTLTEILHDEYHIEERSQLRLFTDERAFLGYNYALNEIAILKRDSSSMITIHTSIDGEYLTSYEADGLVISTPTGSTAYSMSVNGPIIVPQSNSLVLSPVAPHSLNVRPLVIPDTCIISLRVESRSQYFLIALDGRSEVFPSGIHLRVSKADHTTKVIKRKDHTFFRTLREKLMWGADPRMMI